MAPEARKITVDEGNTSDEIVKASEVAPFAEFLEATPPSTMTSISDLVKRKFYQGGAFRGYFLQTPDIQLHCPSEPCNGIRFFRCTDKNEIEVGTATTTFYLTYRCSNCQAYTKLFSLAVERPHSEDEASRSGVAYKFGELPVYGPPVPPRLISMIGPDREIFLKGRRCENQGLGIGAFVYYRRVVENQKNRILDEILKVSRKLAVPEQQIQTLEAAKTETQFSKALASVKNAIPQAVLINGHNPLLLLHSALSDGVHGRTDEECLELAHSVRVVLAELSEKLAHALKDEAELTHALSTLLTKKPTTKPA